MMSIFGMAFPRGVNLIYSGFAMPDDCERKKALLGQKELSSRRIRMRFLKMFPFFCIRV